MVQFILSLHPIHLLLSLCLFLVNCHSCHFRSVLLFAMWLFLVKWKWKWKLITLNAQVMLSLSLSLFLFSFALGPIDRFSKLGTCMPQIQMAVWVCRMHQDTSGSRFLFLFLFTLYSISLEEECLSVCVIEDARHSNCLDRFCLLLLFLSFLVSTELSSYSLKASFLFFGIQVASSALTLFAC